MQDPTIKQLEAILTPDNKPTPREQKRRDRIKCKQQREALRHE
jgi:hypothetical protein